ncbi:isoaspartyl peptidase/L-asparaginase family protein [Pelomicrobium methylotrophicum]|uniref:Isoaspartyl peptidase n=1 Tax=Pelomicrobium methylotrophicum TaxID=2602750 RepID=A0A5C7ER40_9PROT|nr:isoaspartyl peptidase/L-asparaginase [Pelomicrobium methylotrophicum]TXF11058.1 isoaspartyl peptidase/L-asparaginase [Pelomicrobium methylotrophicum]
MFAIAVHGGAGDWSAAPEAPVLDGVTQAARAAVAILAAGGSALDAVVEAVRLLEDNPWFNAGTGSALTASGEVEMDAAVMTGTHLASGGVACIKRVRNPILVARRVLEEGRHVLIAGEGATAFARRCGFADHDPVTPERRQAWERARRGAPPFGETLPPGTVGAVALDVAGELAAATSTGGTMLKLPGRIGDSPVPGAGNYATPQAAVSATGLGELMLRICAAKCVCDAVGLGRSAAEAVRDVLEKMAEVLGTDAGFIAVDRNGGLGIGHLTEHMPHAVATADQPVPVARMRA